MTIDKFRIMHSTIIEHYQFIEHHLEGIYATLCEKNFLLGLEDVEKSNISQLVKKIKKIEKEKQIIIISDSEYMMLEHVCLRRNFWCHNCYVDMVFDRKTGVPKKIEDLRLLIDDLNEAEMLRESLFQKKQTVLKF